MLTSLSVKFWHIHGKYKATQAKVYKSYSGHLSKVDVNNAWGLHVIWNTDFTFSCKLC